MDSSESPTYGEQEGSAIQRPLRLHCYHPLFVFNHLEIWAVCPALGHVHSADGGAEVLEPVIPYRDTVKRRYFRGDAAFANPDIYDS